MKITKDQLKVLIKESLDEGWEDDLNNFVQNVSDTLTGDSPEKRQAAADRRRKAEQERKVWAKRAFWPPKTREAWGTRMCQREMKVWLDKIAQDPGPVNIKDAAWRAKMEPQFSKMCKHHFMVAAGRLETSAQTPLPQGGHGINLESRHSPEWEELRIPFMSFVKDHYTKYKEAFEKDAQTALKSIKHGNMDAKAITNVAITLGGMSALETYVDLLDVLLAPKGQQRADFSAIEEHLKEVNYSMTNEELKQLIKEFVQSDKQFKFDFDRVPDEEEVIDIDTGGGDPPDDDKEESGEPKPDDPFVEYIKALIADLQDYVPEKTADALQTLYDFCVSRRAIEARVHPALIKLQQEKENADSWQMFQDIIDSIQEPDDFLIESAVLHEALSKSDKAEIKKMLNQVLDKKLKSELKKVLKDELEKALKSQDIKQDVGEIAKKVIKKLYKDLSFHHPYIIDRIKI